MTANITLPESFFHCPFLMLDPNEGGTFKIGSRGTGAGQLAEAAHLSPRQFSRAFRAETGQSPAKAVENLRVEAARLMMGRAAIP